MNSFKHLVSSDDGSFNNVKFSISHNTTNKVGTDTRPGTSYYPATVATGTAYVHSLGYNGTNIYFFRGDFSQATAAPGTTNRICLGCRLTTSDFDTSDLMQFILFGSFISKSLRRRFEQASHLSFKIADNNNATSL